VLPVTARQALSSAEECEVHVVEGVGANCLDKSDFIADLV
jgi:hypothetical protein